MASDQSISHFRGFRSPTYTQVPDELFDELLSVLSGAELKVLLYIIRRTFGFKRDADAISLSQMMSGIVTREGNRLDRGVGLSKPTLLQALRSLEASNIIETRRQRSTEKGDEPTIYQLKFAGDDNHEPISGPVVKKLDQGVVKNPNPPVVKKSAPQETGLQQTEISLSNIRKSNRSKDDFVDNTTSQPISFEINRATHQNGQTAHRGVEGVGSIIARVMPQSDTGQPVKRQRGRPRKFQDQDSQTLLNYVSDFAREFADKATLNQSATRMINLYHKWGRGDIDAFVGVLYQARSVTKAQNNIRTSKFAYFCSVVEDLLGLREEQNAVSSRDA